MTEELPPKHTTDLWVLAEEAELKQGYNKNLQKTLIVCGEKSSGKTTFINILKNQTQGDDKYIPTVGVDYQYARRTNVNRKELMHSYELGGGREQNKMLTIPLSKENFRDAFYVIIIDLSIPHGIIDSITFWMDEIRKKVATFNTEKFTSPTEIEAKSNFDFALQSRFESHPDKSRIKAMPIQSIIIGTKYDAFEKLDAENRKWISRTLRYLAHVNAASLYFASNKNPELFQSIRTTINSVLFGKTLAQYFQAEHLRPLAISSGKDELAKMGLPQAAGNMTHIEALKKIITESVPKDESVAAQNQKDIITMIDKFPEARIDSIRAEKDKQMIDFAKQFKNLFDGVSPQKNHKRTYSEEKDFEEQFETSKPQQDYSYYEEAHSNIPLTQQKQKNASSTQSYQSSAPQMIGGSNDQNRVNPYKKADVSKQTQRPAGNQNVGSQGNRQGGLTSLGGLPQLN